MGHGGLGRGLFAVFLALAPRASANELAAMALERTAQSYVRIPAGRGVKRLRVHDWTPPAQRGVGPASAGPAASGNKELKAVIDLTPLSLE